MAFPKLLSAADLAVQSERCRASGGIMVFTNGCFDILHVGHVRYLQAARARGDMLAVALNSDSSVRALKGPGRPVNAEMERAEVLAALGCVDFVTVFDSPRVTDLIREVRPQLYVKGGDYTVETLDPGERAALLEVSAAIEMLQLVPGKSTTAVIKRLTGE